MKNLKKAISILLTLVLMANVFACGSNTANTTSTNNGSNWNNGANTRGFYWNVNNASSNRNRNIGGHLLNA